MVSVDVKHHVYFRPAGMELIMQCGQRYLTGPDETDETMSVKRAPAGRPTGVELFSVKYII